MHGEEEAEVLNKSHYTWWGYIKAIIRVYNRRIWIDLTGVARREQEAVQAAIEATERKKDGENRMKAIRLMHLDGTHTLEGAAKAIPCDRATAARWQRTFFEEVARNRDLLD